MTVLEIDALTGTAEAAAAPPEKDGAPATREIRHEYTRTLPSLLSQLGVSLLVSTYQAGKVVAVGVAQDELTLSYHNFERAMGWPPSPIVAVLGAPVWFLKICPTIRRVEPAGRACFLRALALHRRIQAHELSGPGRAWLVNTAFGCLCARRPAQRCCRGGRRLSAPGRRTAATSMARPWLASGGISNESVPTWYVTVWPRPRPRAGAPTKPPAA